MNNIKDIKIAVRYEKETGKFYWINSPRNGWIGREAGRINHGYRSIYFNHKSLSCHRLAWEFHYGCEPDGFIDHINGDRDDNRIDNLRIVTKSENAMNQRRAKANNQTGYLGVGFLPKIGKYRARINILGKQINIGLYDTPTEAHEAYLERKRALHVTCTI